MKKNKRIYAVLVEPHSVRSLIGPTRDSVSEAIRAAISSLSGMPYPPQYGRNGLLVLADDRGLYKPLPYNRWGVVCTFAVVARHNHPLTQKQVEGVLEDLEDREGGYLDEASGVLNALREPFQQHGIPPAGAVPNGDAWFR